MDDREVIAFTKDGKTMGKLSLQNIYYLQSEEDYINKVIMRSPQFDGVILQIDWDKRQIKTLRYAKDD